MTSTSSDQTDADAAKRKPETETKVSEKLSEQVTKGLSQPPSRAQVPPATAAEEIVQ